MGISNMYSFRSDPDVNVGKIASRRIRCVCDSYISQLSFLWEIEVDDKLQKRYRTKLLYERRICLKTITTSLLLHQSQVAPMKR